MGPPHRRPMRLNPTRTNRTWEDENPLFEETLQESATNPMEHWLAVLGPVLRYAPGVELIRQGDVREDVYYVRHGCVKLAYCEVNGREAIVSIESGPTLIGATAAVLKRPSPFAACTLTLCDTARTSGNQFRDAVAGCSASNLLPMLSDSLYRMTARVTELICLSAQERTLSLSLAECRAR
jgi:CRP-like cAMP-binding protein